MAPKLADIKSESWLDLSKEQPIERPKWLLRRAQTQIPDSSGSSSDAWSNDAAGDCRPNNNNDEMSDNYDRGERRQIQGVTTIEQQQERVIAQQQRLSRFADTRFSSSNAGSTCSLQAARSSQEHLLIRIRQESFRLSRRRSSLSDMQKERQQQQQDQSETRTTTTTKSIMATTISCTSSLEHSLQISDLINELNESASDKTGSQNSRKTISQQQQVSLSSRLQRFKSRLDSRRRRSSSLLRMADHQELASDDENPPLSAANVALDKSCDKDKGSLFSQRSFSNLGDKFSHLRRSWRKFLSSSTQTINANNNYQSQLRGKNILSTKAGAGKDKMHASDTLWQPLDDATDPINKRLLTERWLANHHQLERPRSLQIDRRQLYSEDNLEAACLQAGSIGRDSSSSKTLVEPLQPINNSDNNNYDDQAIWKYRRSSLIINNNKQSGEKLSVVQRKDAVREALRARATSLEPSSLHNNHRLLHSQQFQQQVNLEQRVALEITTRGASHNNNNKFASLRTDTEGSRSTSSSRTTTTTSSSQSSYARNNKLQRMNNSSIMQQQRHLVGQHQPSSMNMLNQQQLITNIPEARVNNKDLINQPDNTQLQPALPHTILSIAPDEYYLDAADEDEGDNGAAGRVAGAIGAEQLAFNNQQSPQQLIDPVRLQNSQYKHHQHQQHLMMVPQAGGLWPGYQRGHSVEAQSSTGGSSSLERPMATSYQQHNQQQQQQQQLHHNQMIMQMNHQNYQQQQQNMFNNNKSSLMVCNSNNVAGQDPLSNDADCLFGMQTTADPDYDDYAIPSDENFCRLDRTQVELVQMIGEGQKGFVFLGKLQSRDGQQIIDVAIKTLKYETEAMIEKLMHEAAMMRQFEHPHIIRFIGVCPETPALIAMELAKLGELRHYLRANQHLVSVSQLVLFSFQISTALSYLESKQFVHRDVAARNVLVCSHTCVKLADFGLSRNLQMEPPGCQFVAAGHPTRMNALNQQQRSGSHSHLNHSFTSAASSQLLLEPDDKNGHYVACSPGKLPVRWLAPESLAFRRFTSASDVWMFAVCTWEVFYLGQLRPWPHIANNQVLAAIGAGQRLTRPPACPARLYQLLLRCWSFAPIRRPKFRDIKQELWSIYLSERTREQILIDEVNQEKRDCHLLALAAAARQHQQQQQDDQQQQYDYQQQEQQMLQQQLNDKRMRQILKQQELSRRQQQAIHEQQQPGLHNKQPQVSHEQQQQHPKNLDKDTQFTDKIARLRNAKQQTTNNKQNHHSPEPLSRSGSCSLARRRRLLLSSPQGARQQLLPISTSPHKLECPQQIDNSHSFEINSSSGIGSYRRRNQLQKQRSHGSIIGFGLESTGEAEDILAPSTQHSKHQRKLHEPKDDQALLTEEKVRRKTGAFGNGLKSGHSERLLSNITQYKSANRNQPPAYEGVGANQHNNHNDLNNLENSFQFMQLDTNKNQDHSDELRDEYPIESHDEGGHLSTNSTLSPAQKRELEQRNRLDLHRRLLGHIRPASSAGSNRTRDRANRNSLNLMSDSTSGGATCLHGRQPTNDSRLHQNQHQANNKGNLNRPLPHPPNISSATRVKSVDQSLEILASLISTTNSKSEVKRKLRDERTRD